MAVKPGPITHATAREVDSWMADVAENKRTLELMAAQRTLPTFEAAVTDYDPATGRYSFYEQDIDSNGQRYQQPGGRFGDATMNPAYAVGDGSGIAMFPYPVVMRERGLHTVAGDFLGMAYEFPLYCACVGGGSGGSGGFVLVRCCPNPLPETLYVTVSIPTVPCADGTIIPIVWSSVLQAWVSKEFAPLEVNWFPSCTGADTIAPIFLSLACVCPFTCTFQLGISSGVEGGAGFKFATFASLGSGVSGTMWSSGSLFPGFAIWTCSPFTSYFDRSNFNNGPTTLNGTEPVTFFITE